MTIVSVSLLTKRFGELTAVDGVSFEVAKGELFGIVGPDGAGKTTTLRMLAGVMKPSAGDARLAGMSVVREPEGVKHVIAYMSQRFGLYADLTVRENLDFYADLYRVPRATREATLARLFEFSGLGPFQHRLAGKLSGGMKQKLGLSCALIHEPQILLLDEPTFGVDPISRRDLWIIVHEMVAHGVTVVVSTSYMDEAERFDRVAFLHRGGIIALDTPDALLARQGSDRFAVRAADVRAAEQTCAALPFVRSAVVFGDRIHVALASPADDLPRLEAALGTPATAVAPTLESVFIDSLSAEEEA